MPIGPQQTERIASDRFGLGQPRSRLIEGESSGGRGSRLGRGAASGAGTISAQVVERVAALMPVGPRDLHSLAEGDVDMPGIGILPLHRMILQSFPVAPQRGRSRFSIQLASPFPFPRNQLRSSRKKRLRLPAPSA